MKQKTRQAAMKSFFAVLFLMGTMTLGFTSCNSDDDDYEFTAEEIAYFELNTAFVEEKKLEKDEEGNLLYKVVTYEGQPLLYRVLGVESEGEGKVIEKESMVTMVLKGELINGKVFQEETSMNYRPVELIPGVALALLESREHQIVEAIFPASLGYGYYDNRPGIQKGSTLIFTFTVKKVE